MTFQAAVKLANDNGLITPFVDNNNSENSLIVFNHLSPFFRFACEAKFVNGKLTTTKSFLAD